MSRLHWVIELKESRSFFYKNGYPNCLFDKFLNNFGHHHTAQNDDLPVSEKFVLFEVSYVKKRTAVFR